MLYCSCLKQVQVLKISKEDSVMKKTSKLLMGFQVAILMTAVALPAQAAMNIGAPQTLSGSVISLQSYVPGTTIVTPVPTPATQTTVTTPTTTNIQTSAPTQYQWTLPSNLSGSVVSLKGILSQPTTSVTSTPITPTPTPATTTTTPTTTNSTIPAVTALTANEQHMVDMINQERSAAGVGPMS